MQQTDYKEQYNNQLVRTVKIPMRCKQTDYKEQYNNQLVRTVKIPMRCSKPITRNSTTTNQLEQ